MSFSQGIPAKKKKKLIILFILTIICLLAGITRAQSEFYKKNIHSFNAGELSSLLNVREDLSKFHSGLSTMENMIPLPQGAAQKRPGTKYVAESKENTKIRLLPFEYSTEQSYIFELGNQYIRFFTDNAIVYLPYGTEDLSAFFGSTGDGSLVAHWLCDDNAASTTVLDNVGTHDGTAQVNTNTISVTDAESTANEALNINDANFVTIPNAIDAYTKLLLHCDGTDGSTTVPDSSASDHTITCVGNAQLDTVHKKFDSASLLFDGTGDYCTIPDHADWDFGTDPFTIDLWVRFSVNTGYRILCGTTWQVGDRGYILYMHTGNAVLHFGYSTNGADAVEWTFAWSPAIDTWYHVAIVRNGADFKAYADGTQIGSTQNISTNNVNNFPEDPFYIGADLSGLTYMVGWLDEIRVSKGVARWTTDFTPNTTSYSSAFSFGNGTADSPFSLVAWVYYSSSADQQTIISKYTAANQEWLVYLESSGQINVQVFDDSATANFTAETATGVVATGWHMIGVTLSGDVETSTPSGGDGKDVGVTVYVDWEEIPTTVIASNLSNYVAMESLTADVIIGAESTNQNSWHSKIDNVAVFNKELSLLEIATLTGNDSTTIYSITTPYLTADLFEIKYEQSADVLYLTHPDYETRKLSRYANAFWTIEPTDTQSGPFRGENTNIIKIITPSGTTGSITLTATGHSPFEIGTTAGHEPSGSASTSKSRTGALFKLVQPLATGAYEEILSDNYTDDQAEDVSWMDCGSIAKGVTWYLTTLGTWTGTLEVQRNYTIGAAHGAAGWETAFTYQSTDDRNAITSAEETVDEADYRVILTASGDAAEPCQCYFRISDTDHVGIVEITAVTDSKTATGTVIKTLADTTATHRWSEGSWSNYRGWPRTVTFFEDRLTFGGNDSQPDTIWASTTSDYENMTAGADDDEALAFTLSSRQVNVIEWIIGKNKLLIGTSGAEWTISGGTDEPLTPSNVKAEQHSTYGSADLQAVLASESVLFFQRGSEKMRELAYNWETDAYVAPDMTILSPEITGDGITDVAYQQTPNSILWCVRDDGEMAIFVYERKELITSWARFITDGLFESVAVINGDPEDEIWVSVNRTIGGETQRYIEYFAARDFGSDVDDAYYVDCGVTYDSTATTSITNLGHLIAEEVSVFGDGVIQTSQTVDGSGDITITSAFTVQAGLPFTVQMRTMPLSMASEGNFVLGRKKRISQVIPQYYNSGDFYVGKDSTTKELLSISGMDTSDVDTDDRITFPAGYDRFGRVFIYQQSPEPLTLISLLLEFGVN